MSKFDEAKGLTATVSPSLLPRRSLLRGGLAAALLPGASLLTACSGGDDDGAQVIPPAPGSVGFANTHKKARRLSYFLTDTSALLNAMDFADTGYTVEAFVKIDKDWNSRAEMASRRRCCLRSPACAKSSGKW